MDEETPWLDRSELDDWIPFSAMLVTLTGTLDAQLQRDAGLSFFSYSVLAGLSEAPDHTIRLGELAVLASGSLSRLSHTITRLERQGLVVRSPLPGDGRVTVATLTPAGLDKVRAAAPAHVRTVREVLDRIGGDRLHGLGDTSRIVLDHLGVDLAITRRGVGQDV